jgi:FkbM family methyltransferase
VGIQLAAIIEDLKMSAQDLTWRLYQVMPNMLRRNIKRTIFSIGAACHMVPYGSNFVFDLKRRIPKVAIDLIFDVGANRGQTVREYRADFPRSRIISFEPDPDTFLQLKASTSGQRLVEVHNVGISDVVGKVRFDNSCPITETHCIAADQNNDRFPLVDVTTLDLFCSNNKIDHIDLLKIDTEGHDLKVLRGASDLLNRSAISVIVAECTFEANCKTHIPFGTIQQEMEARGYLFFGLYQQSLGSGKSTKAHVTWANCAYVSERAARTAMMN